MALTKQALKRTFTYRRRDGDITLPDPNPAMSPEQVMAFYSTQYPELTTSLVSGPAVSGTALAYEFRSTVGTKG